MSLAGRLSFNPLTDALDDGQGGTFTLTPPAKAPETPGNGFDPGRAFYHAPPEDGAGVAVEVSPDSERLQILEPFAPWDGEDIVDAPVLIKTAGKCTTDHISARRARGFDTAATWSGSATTCSWAPRTPTPATLAPR